MLYTQRRVSYREWVLDRPAWAVHMYFVWRFGNVNVDVLYDTRDSTACICGECLHCGTAYIWQRRVSRCMYVWGTHSLSDEHSRYPPCNMYLTWGVCRPAGRTRRWPTAPRSTSTGMGEPGAVDDCAACVCACVCVRMLVYARVRVQTSLCKIRTG